MAIIRKAFTPVWIDSENNKIVFPTSEAVFEDYAGARAYQLQQVAYMRKRNVHEAGMLEAMANGLSFNVPHLSAKLGDLGPCKLIGGPMFDAQAAKQGMTGGRFASKRELN